MNCYQCQDSISVYIEKQLPLSATSEFEEHIARCSDCLKAYEGVMSVIAGLRNARKVGVSTEFNVALQDRLTTLSTRPAKRFSQYFEGRRVFGFEPRYAFASMAAVIAIVILTISLFPDSHSSSLQQQTVTNRPQQVMGANDTTTESPPAEDVEGAFASDSQEDSVSLQKKSTAPTRDFRNKIQLVNDPK